MGNQNVSGQQYVVFVNGGSDLLLEQVRMVEPTAFRTNHQGQTVIQAGRFNSPQNANSRLNELSRQGIGATVAEVPTAFSLLRSDPDTVSRNLLHLMVHCPPSQRVRFPEAKSREWPTPNRSLNCPP